MCCNKPPVLKILSWNILHGGGSRCDAILQTIEAANVDIVLLQEFRHGKSKPILIGGLQDIGLSNTFAPETANARDNGLLIACRLPVNATEFPAQNSAPARAIAVEINLDSGETLRLINVHFPQKRAQIPLFEALLDLPEIWLSDYALLAGDFNCGIPLEDSQTKTFYATRHFQRLLQSGWIDSWRSRNLKAREFSWVSTRKGNGFRYDHALASPSLDKLIDSVHYDHKVREDGTSDHSLMTLAIDLI